LNVISWGRSCPTPFYKRADQFRFSALTDVGRTEGVNAPPFSLAVGD
jgi:hypothetical protein